MSFINAPDTLGYIEKFNFDIQPIPGYIDTQYEIGYTVLAMVFKTVCPHYWFFQLVVFGIEVFLIIKGLRYYYDERTCLVIIPLLFFLYPTNLFAFRQGIATSIFIYALHYINADTLKKSFIYFLLIGIAVLFHQSAIVLILVYFIRFAKRIISYRWLVLAVLILGDFLWASNTTILSQFNFLMPFFYGDTLDMGEKYAILIEGANKLGTFGLAKVFEINVAVLLFVLYCKNDKHYEVMCFNMLIYVIVGLFIGGFVAHRLNYYWTILYYVCFARGVMELPILKKSLSISFSIMALYMFWFFVIKSGYIKEDYLFLFSY